VFVIRGDAIASWTHDYGPAENFRRVQEILIPSFGENTVGQLQDLAERNRHDTYWANRSDEMLAESTLIGDVLKGDEERKNRIRNRSTIGPHVRIERNGYSRGRTHEIMKERKRGS